MSSPVAEPLPGAGPLVPGAGPSVPEVEPGGASVEGVDGPPVPGGVVGAFVPLPEVGAVVLSPVAGGPVPLVPDPGPGVGGVRESLGVEGDSLVPAVEVVAVLGPCRVPTFGRVESCEPSSGLRVTSTLLVHTH